MCCKFPTGTAPALMERRLDFATQIRIAVMQVRNVMYVYKSYFFLRRLFDHMNKKTYDV